jgi:AraC-like DNA-binding protein
MSALSTILRTKLLPWINDNAGQRCIVARTAMRQSDMPRDVQISRVKIPGERIITKNRRQDNHQLRAAFWPQASLTEVRRLKLVCVLAGRAHYQLGKFMLNCGPGHFICIPPGIPHSDGTLSCVAPNANYCELFYVLQYSNAIQVWIDRFETGGNKPLTERNYLFYNEKLVRLFQLMMEICEEESSVVESPVMDGITKAFFSLLYREAKQENYILVNQTDYNDLSQSADFGNEEFTAALQHFIQTHLNERLTVEKAARQLFMSRAQLTRRMRRETGKTFVEYVTEYRIEEAKRLLADTKWTASTIAGVTGFNTATYFYRVFRKCTGASPTVYRKQQTKKK